MAKLVLLFNSSEEFFKAHKFFDGRSEFYPESVDEDEMKFTFGEESDSLEALGCAITDELEKEGFLCYWFERAENAEQVIIEANREGYALDQVRRTMTVRELIDYLEQFSDDAKVYLSHDNGYTYGGITEQCFK